MEVAAESVQPEERCTCAGTSLERRAVFGFDPNVSTVENGPLSRAREAVDRRLLLSGTDLETEVGQLVSGKALGQQTFDVPPGGDRRDRVPTICSAMRRQHL